MGKQLLSDLKAYFCIQDKSFTLWQTQIDPFSIIPLVARRCFWYVLLRRGQPQDWKELAQKFLLEVVLSDLSGNIRGRLRYCCSAHIVDLLLSHNPLTL